MINGKTYYQILGVLPDAEDIVIKAAYRSLAQKYHPDKWDGDPDLSIKRMSEINCAYEELSDPKRRGEYERQYGGERNDAGATADESGSFVDDKEAEGFDEFVGETRKDWKIASKYYPSIERQYLQLRSLNKSLSLTFRKILLDTKAFAESSSLFERLRHKYLSTYFGDDPSIQDFAEILIKGRHREAALELNQIIFVLRHEVPSQRLIGDISIKFLTGSGENDFTSFLSGGTSKGRGFSGRLSAARARLRREQDDLSADHLVEVLCGRVIKRGGILDREITLWIHGQTFEFRSVRDYVEFVSKRYGGIVD